MTTIDLIVGYSKTVLGQQEKPGNGGFKSEWIEKKMKERGFVKGDPWCALAFELIWHEAYQGTKYEKEINELCSKSAVQTYFNFLHTGSFPYSPQPLLGAGVFWRYFKNGTQTWQGHVGIVVEVHPGYFITIEGNGNDQGGREGIAWVKRKRTFTKPATGLRLLGFIHPIELKV